MGYPVVFAVREEAEERVVCPVDPSEVVDSEEESRVVASTVESTAVGWVVAG